MKKGEQKASIFPMFHPCLFWLATPWHQGQRQSGIGVSGSKNNFGEVEKMIIFWNSIQFFLEIYPIAGSCQLGTFW